MAFTRFALAFFLCTLVYGQDQAAKTETVCVGFTARYCDAAVSCKGGLTGGIRQIRSESARIITVCSEVVTNNPFSFPPKKGIRKDGKSNDCWQHVTAGKNTSQTCDEAKPSPGIEVMPNGKTTNIPAVTGGRRSGNEPIETDKKELTK